MSQKQKNIGDFICWLWIYTVKKSTCNKSSAKHDKIGRHTKHWCHYSIQFSKSHSKPPILQNRFTCDHCDFWNVPKISFFSPSYSDSRFSFSSYRHMRLSTCKSSVLWLTGIRSLVVWYRHISFFSCRLLFRLCKSLCIGAMLRVHSIKPRCDVVTNL